MLFRLSKHSRNSTPTVCRICLNDATAAIVHHIAHHTPVFGGEESDIVNYSWYDSEAMMDGGPTGKFGLVCTYTDRRVWPH